MVTLSGAFSRLEPIRALVVGDFMLDIYTTGKVKKISPEAPVSILQVEKEEYLPGGAGNVGMNLTSLGAKVIALGRIGNDFSAKKLLAPLKEEGVEVSSLFVEKTFSTPIKNRLIAGSQQILRVDQEKMEPLSIALEGKILQMLPSLLQKVDVVAISDYQKGFLSEKLLRALIECSQKRGIPILVDPKGVDFEKYEGATLIKPNQQEAYLAAHLPESIPLKEVAAILLEKTKCKHLFITRSEKGISLFSSQGKELHFPAQAKEVKDVTGAGDTVLAILCVAMANSLDLSQTATLANIAASIVIERIGCARVTLSELARRLLWLDTKNKIFEESHLYALKEILRGKPFSIIGVDSSEGITTALLTKIHQQRKQEEQEVIIYVRDPFPCEHFIDLIASFKEVSFILLKQESLKGLGKKMEPKQVFLIQEHSVYTLKTIQELLVSG